MRSFLICLLLPPPSSSHTTFPSTRGFSLFSCQPLTLLFPLAPGPLQEVFPLTCPTLTPGLGLSLLSPSPESLPYHPPQKPELVAPLMYCSSPVHAPTVAIPTIFHLLVFLIILISSMRQVCPVHHCVSSILPRDLCIIHAYHLLK